MAVVSIRMAGCDMCLMKNDDRFGFGRLPSLLATNMLTVTKEKDTPVESGGIHLKPLNVEYLESHLETNTLW